MKITVRTESALSHPCPTLARGRETGCLYLMVTPKMGIALETKGGIRAGSQQTQGGFTPLPRGTVVEIVV